VVTYTLIAEEAPAAPAPPTGTGAGSPGPFGGDYGIFIMMGLIFAVFYFLLIRPQRKKEQARQRDREEMLKRLTKNDHVVTIGGLHGIVASVTDTDVVIKVDEKNDVRMRFAREAINRVVTDGDKGAGGLTLLGAGDEKR